MAENGIRGAEEMSFDLLPNFQHMINCEKTRTYEDLNVKGTFSQPSVRQRRKGNKPPKAPSSTQFLALCCVMNDYTMIQNILQTLIFQVKFVYIAKYIILCCKYTHDKSPSKIMEEIAKQGHFLVLLNNLCPKCCVSFVSTLCLYCKFWDINQKCNTHQAQIIMWKKRGIPQHPSK